MDFLFLWGSQDLTRGQASKSMRSYSESRRKSRHCRWDSTVHEQDALHVFSRSMTDLSIVFCLIFSCTSTFQTFLCLCVSFFETGKNILVLVEVCVHRWQYRYWRSPGGRTIICTSDTEDIFGSKHMDSAISRFRTLPRMPTRGAG